MGWLRTKPAGTYTWVGAMASVCSCPHASDPGSTEGGGKGPVLDGLVAEMQKDPLPKASTTKQLWVLGHSFGLWEGCF